MKSSGSMASWGRASAMYLCSHAAARSPIGTYAVLLALALANQDQAPVQRQVEELQMDHLQTAQSGRIEHFQDGAVAQADWLVDVGLGHDPLDLLNGEDVPGQRAAQPGQVDLGGRVMQDVVLPRHPSEPHAQRHKPRVLRAEGQRLAVLLAVKEQVPLIAFEHGPRDFDRVRAGRVHRPTR